MSRRVQQILQRWLNYQDKGINVGFGHTLPRSNISLVLNAAINSVHVQRLVEQAKAENKLVDLTNRRACRSIIITHDGRFLKSIRRAAWVQQQLSDVSSSD